MGSFILFVLEKIVDLLIFAIIVNAIISWLVAFNVINLRNPFAYQVARFFDAVTTPILAPFRRFVPNLGGVDISPIFAWIVLQGIASFLLPWAFGPIIAAIG